MLRDQVDDRLREAVLAGQVGPVLDVRDDHQRAHGGSQRLVAVLVGPLVLDEVVRLEHLADVVEVGPHADQQPAGVDALGGGLGNRADGDRMVVGARRPADKLLQERMGDVAEFQQAQVGQHAEEAFDEGQQAEDDEARGDGPQRRCGAASSKSGRLIAWSSIMPKANCNSTATAPANSPT